MSHLVYATDDSMRFTITPRLDWSLHALTLGGRLKNVVRLLLARRLLLLKLLGGERIEVIGGDARPELCWRRFIVLDHLLNGRGFLPNEVSKVLAIRSLLLFAGGALSAIPDRFAILSGRHRSNGTSATIVGFRRVLSLLEELGVQV